MNDFKTVYIKDYVQYPNVKPTQCRPPFKKNPILDSFKEYLQLDPPTEPCPDKSDEYWKDFYEREFKVKYPHLAERYFKEGIDTELIKKHRRYDNYTIYQKELCKMDKMTSEKKAYAFEIDINNLAETTQRSSYRNPTIIDKRALDRVGKIIPEPMLGGENKFAEAGKLEADESTYMGTIGKLGEEIIVEQMLGKMNYFN